MTHAAIELVIPGRARDIGGFPVQRVLPFAKRRAVGPFVFLDRMGPHRLAPDEAVDVLPHPHIGLSTLTYLFAGELLHRDSLGSVQAIRPGAVNWMHAGRGIVHSERTPPALRGQAHALDGVQVWLADPRADETGDPWFAHHAAEALPTLHDDDRELRIILGDWEGTLSPVRTLSPALYADVRLDAGGTLPIPAGVEERAIYILAGSVAVTGSPARYAAGNLLAFGRGALEIRAADGPLHAMVLGGAPLDGPRFIEWNFVSSSRERIEQAKADWVARRFPDIPGESGFIPLPASGPREVSYP